MKNLDENISSDTQTKNSWLKHMQILNAGLYDLEEIERKAILFRYWQKMSIEQIACELKISWDQADQIINHAVDKLRQHFAGAGITNFIFQESRKK